VRRLEDFVTPLAQCIAEQEWPTEIANVRTYHDPNCQFCRANHGEMYPPHDASQNCESGKRAHCSCDVCF